MPTRFKQEGRQRARAARSPLSATTECRETNRQRRKHQEPCSGNPRLQRHGRWKVSAECSVFWAWSLGVGGRGRSVKTHTRNADEAAQEEMGWAVVVVGAVPVWCAWYSAAGASSAWCHLPDAPRQPKTGGRHACVRQRGIALRRYATAAVRRKWTITGMGRTYSRRIRK